MGTLTRTLRLLLKVKDAVIVVFPPRNAAHIISSHRWRRRHLEKDAQRYYSGTRAWNCCFFATAAISVFASETGGGNYRQSRSDENIHFVLLCIISACDSLSAVLMNCPPQKRAAWNLLRVLWILEMSCHKHIMRCTQSYFDRKSTLAHGRKFSWERFNSIISCVSCWNNTQCSFWSKCRKFHTDSIINIRKYLYLYWNILNMKPFPSYFMKMWIMPNKIRF